MSAEGGMMRRTMSRSEQSATREPSPERRILQRAIHAVLEAGIAGNTHSLALAEQLSALRYTCWMGDAEHVAGCSAEDLQVLRDYCANRRRESLHALFLGALRDAGGELRVPGRVMDHLRYGMNKHRHYGGVLAEVLGTVALVTAAYVTVVILFSLGGGN